MVYDSTTWLDPLYDRHILWMWHFHNWSDFSNRVAMTGHDDMTMTIANSGTKGLAECPSIAWTWTVSLSQTAARQQRPTSSVSRWSKMKRARTILKVIVLYLQITRDMSTLLSCSRQSIFCSSGKWASEEDAELFPGGAMEVRLPRLSAVQEKVLEAVPLQSVEHPGQNEGLLMTRFCTDCYWSGSSVFPNSDRSPFIHV